MIRLPKQRTVSNAQRAVRSLVTPLQRGWRFRVAGTQGAHRDWSEYWFQMRRRADLLFNHLSIALAAE